MTTPYDSSFFDSLHSTSESSAKAMASWICKVGRPDSVLDVGCAEGIWSAEFMAQGVPTVIGVDGDYVDLDRLLIPGENYQAVDLNSDFSLGRRFDLAVCLEVAEHLEEASADEIVRSIAGHTDVVLFSAAIPLQGGTFHRNEQWPAYWIERFENAGYETLDVVRPLFWQDQTIAPWYRQNAMLFCRNGDAYAQRLNDAVRGLASFQGAALVHPEWWLSRNSTAEHSVGEFAGPGARLNGMGRSIGRVISRQISGSAKVES